MPEQDGPHYLATVFVTEGEYEQRKRGQPESDELDRHIKLKEFTKAGDMYSEGDIPRIIADAAEVLNINTGTLDPDDYKVYEWPFQLKIAVMHAAINGWTPNVPDSGPQWTGGDERARDLFESVPELVEVFRKSPGEVGRIWTARHRRENG